MPTVLRVAVPDVAAVMHSLPRCSGPCRCPASRKRDAAAAKTRLHERFRWFGGGWKVNAELPGPASFAGATTDVRPEDVAESIPCGADVDAVIQACTPFAEAGFTDLALVQIGGQQQGTFLDWAEQNLRPELRRRLG